MNSIRHALAQIASSQPTRERLLVLRSSCLSQCYSTATTKQSGRKSTLTTTTKGPEEFLSIPPEEPLQLQCEQMKVPPAPLQSRNVAGDSRWPRPTEIPFQSKVANSVNLIGYVHMPVQSEASVDGKYWAGTIIGQDATSDSPPLWIPVIFEGDLAHIATFHLKENDRVCITGQLVVHADPPPFNVPQGQANVQVMAHSVNFVNGSALTKKSSASFEQEEGILKHSASVKKDGNSTLDSWRDLLHNPKQWWDYRTAKLNGSLKPKHPDFKHKDRGIALWLNSAPQWVVSELKELEFDHIDRSRETKPQKGVDTSKQTNLQKGDELWKNLLESPHKWWDNRVDKISKNYPDFKHKDTGEALWLNRAPEWVQLKLPSPKIKDTVIRKTDTILS